MAVRYNEPAWRSDVISEINRLVRNAHCPIQRAGGEYSVTGGATALFPDILLFRDPGAAVILQGWELKFPDTNIDDPELLRKAQEKATRLGLDSFLVWNVAVAKLYRLRKDGARTLMSEWHGLRDIRRRADVKPAESRWKALLVEIIDDLNDRFARHSLRGRPFVAAYESTGLVALVERNRDDVARQLRRAQARSARLRHDMALWWRAVSGEFERTDTCEIVLARTVLINWLSKFLFAHLLSPKFEAAGQVTDIQRGVSPREALRVFDKISRACDFWSVFEPALGQSAMPARTWAELLEFNRLLADLRLGAISQEQLRALLECTVSAARRELRGQFTTPPALAQLLVRLAFDDVNGIFGDPCCGTGTIPRAALDLKREFSLSDAKACRSVWASDWCAEPLQLAAIAMAPPHHMGHVLQVFQKDAFELAPKQTVQLTHPNDGRLVERKLPRFHAIATNLPFVAQNGRRLYSQQIAAINDWLADCLDQEGALPGRSDVAAYFPFCLWRLLRSHARLVIVLTNAWLGTCWGEVFRQTLLRFFKLEAVVASACGRWFRNTDIITNLLVLQKRASVGVPAPEERTSFVLTRRPIGEWATATASAELAAAIRTGQSVAELAEIRLVDAASLDRAARLGLAGSAQFVDWQWALDLPLVRVASLFTVLRGARRGWDALFYPEGEHGIEHQYLTPVLKSIRHVRGYVADPDAFAFTCSESRESLRRLGHTGALAWIARFESAANRNGQPLPEVLARPGLRWYELRPDETADIVVAIDFGDRLFIPRLRARSFINQRVAGLRTTTSRSDLELCHALLNSAVSLFWLEGMGFGRGLGALDLNKDKLEQHMMMLNPAHVDARGRRVIRRAWRPLVRRDALPLPDELARPDRCAFDRAMLNCFGMRSTQDRVYDALTQLHLIRQGASER